MVVVQYHHVLAPDGRVDAGGSSSREKGHGLDGVQVGRRWSVQAVKRHAWRHFADVFLPVGFPSTVTPDYAAYQCWDTLQALSSSLSNTLASMAMLEAVGVGKANASVAAAMMSWLLRDGTGMAGRILFTKVKGRSLDSEAKQWRLFADMLDDAARGVQLCAPLCPASLQSTVMCVASLGFAIVGVAGGATRAALTQHQAVDNNMADVSAKDASQETAVNLVALVLSMVMVPLVDEAPKYYALVLFVVCAAAHVVCNYQACRSVQLPTLNTRRLVLVVEAFLLQHAQDLSGKQPGNGGSFGLESAAAVPGPGEAALLEDLWLTPWPRPQDLSTSAVHIRVGGDLQEVSEQEVETNLVHFQDEPYALVAQTAAGSYKVHVLLARGLRPADELRAMFHTCSLRAVLAAGQDRVALSQLPHQLRVVSLEDVVSTGGGQGAGAVACAETLAYALRGTKRFVDEHYGAFHTALVEAGWRVDQHQVDVGEWRSTWS